MRLAAQTGACRGTLVVETVTDHRRVLQPA